MRKLALFCAALFASLFVFALCRGSLSSAASVAISLLPALLSLLLLIRRKKIFGVCFAGALAGAAAALLFSVFVLDPAYSLCLNSQTLSVRVSDAPENYGTGTSVRGTLLSANGKSTLPYAVTVVLSDTPADVPEPGDLLVFRGRLTPEKSSYRLRDGCFLKAGQEDAGTLTRRGADSFLCAVKRLSIRCSAAARDIFPGDAGALAAALLCGDRSAFSDEFTSSLYKSGLSHMVAVSGMHVSVIAALMIFLLGRKAGVMLSIPVITLYALFTGCSPSVLRASFMALVFALSYLLARSYDSLTALAAAAVFIGLSNPFSLTSSSFLLSFSATLGIILFCPSLSAAMKPGRSSAILKKLLSFITDAVAVCISALIFTMPLSLVFFRSVSLVSPLSNAAVVWAAAPAMLFSAPALLLSALFPGASAVFAFVPSLFLKYIVFATRFFGSLSLTARTENVFLIIFVLILLAVALLVRFKKQSFRSGAALIAAAFVLCLFSSLALGAGVREASVFGADGVSCVCFSDGRKLYALNLPGSFSASSFINGELDSAGETGFAAAVVSKEGPSFSGNADRTETLIFPSELEEGGEIGGVSVTALYCGGEYALFSDFGKLTLLDVCAIAPASWAETPAFAPCDLLIINGKWLSSPTFLSSLCSKCRPSAVLAAEAGELIPENAKETCGCPVLALGDCERVRLTVPR